MMRYPIFIVGARFAHSRLHRAQRCVPVTSSDMRKQGDATLAPIQDIVANAAEELNANVAVNSGRMIGIVGQDQHACYSALLVGVRTADDNNILMSALVTATVVRGKPIFSAIYHEYRGPETTQRSLEEAKSLAAVFDAKNP